MLAMSSPTKPKLARRPRSAVSIPLNPCLESTQLEKICMLALLWLITSVQARRKTYFAPGRGHAGRFSCQPDGFQYWRKCCSMGDAWVMLLWGHHQNRGGMNSNCTESSKSPLKFEICGRLRSLVFKAISAVSEQMGSRPGRAESASRLRLKCAFRSFVCVLEGFSLDGCGFVLLFDPKDTRDTQFTGAIAVSAFFAESRGCSLSRPGYYLHQSRLDDVQSRNQLPRVQGVIKTCEMAARLNV